MKDGVAAPHTLADERRNDAAADSSFVVSVLHNHVDEEPCAVEATDEVAAIRVVPVLQHLVRVGDRSPDIFLTIL